MNHQFKPSVLDEVDYSLHYFQQVLFDAMPLLRSRIYEALIDNYPDVQMPSESFVTLVLGLDLIGMEIHQ